MKVLKIPLNKETDHYDKELGPPIPHAMWLKGVWGCPTHDSCIRTQHFSDETRRWELKHEPLQDVYDEHVKLCKNSPGCRYWVHWLMGEYERPGGGYSTGYDLEDW